MDNGHNVYSDSVDLSLIFNDEQYFRVGSLVGFGWRDHLWGDDNWTFLLTLHHALLWETQNEVWSNSMSNNVYAWQPFPVPHVCKRLMQRNWKSLAVESLSKGAAGFHITPEPSGQPPKEALNKPPNRPVNPHMNPWTILRMNQTLFGLRTATLQDVLDLPGVFCLWTLWILLVLLGDSDNQKHADVKRHAGPS